MAVLECSRTPILNHMVLKVVNREILIVSSSLPFFFSPHGIGLQAWCLGFVISEWGIWRFDCGRGICGEVSGRGGMEREGAL